MSAGQPAIATPKLRAPMLVTKAQLEQMRRMEAEEDERDRLVTEQFELQEEIERPRREKEELAKKVAEVRAEMARRKVEAETKRIIELQRQELVAAQVLDFVGVNPLAQLVAAYTEELESEKVL